MAAPALPTVTDIVTQALKRAGRTVPTAPQITEATNHALQEVKADIMLVAPSHKNLLYTATTVTTRGQQRYAVPEDWNIQESITLLDGPDTWRGTAQGGSATGIIFDAAFSESADSLVGKYVLLTSGPGVEEYRQILTYDDSSKEAMIDLPWLNTPTSATAYLIISFYRQLWPTDMVTEFDRESTQSMLGLPQSAVTFGQEFLLYPVPDKSTYGLVNRYYADLSMLDETGNLFIQILREWRSIFIQGIAVKTMQRFDEDRYQSELSVYNFMLSNLASQTCRIAQMRQID